ncbi:MAG: hypothetical protein HS126_24790 [Anaerolineales bacterium]|nr:hypothetical protein [Anaerolineales bacterium]
MLQTDVEVLKEALQRHWPGQPDNKARGYVGQFLMERAWEQKFQPRWRVITAFTPCQSESTSEESLLLVVVIGKHGYCHHCAALALTFLNDPASFSEIKTKPLAAVQGLAELTEYLHSVTLDELLQELKARGITRKPLPKALG